MRIVYLRLFAGVAVCAASVWALQSGLAQIGVTQAKFEDAVRAATRSSYSISPASYAGRAGVSQFKALPPATRAALVTEALTAAKAIVSTPAFAKAHDEYLAKNSNAINHGPGAAQTDVAKSIQSDPEAAVKKIMAGAAAQMGESIRKQTNVQGLKILLDMDLQEGDAKLKKIAPLLQSNPEEFRKQYSLWKSAQMGGPTTEAEYQAALAGAGAMQSQQDRADQQRRYDENNLKAILRKRLDEFIATAATVDFAAQTRQEGAKLKFVNPAYERKTGEWKMMFRAGKEPVQAALAFARAWRKEL